MNKKHNYISVLSPVLLFSVIVAVLYSQFYLIYTFKNSSDSGIRFAVATPVSILAGIVYAYFSGYVFRKLIQRNNFYRELQVRFIRSHYSVFLLIIYPVQFYIRNEYFNQYLLPLMVMIFISTLFFYFLAPLFRHLHPETVTGKKKHIPGLFLWPLIFTLALTLYLYIWHYGIAFIYLDMKNFDRGLMRGPMVLLLLYYTIVSAVISWVLYLITGLKRRSLRIFLYTILGFCGAFSIFARSLEFGTYFYSGAHVDNVIWAHFLYKENLMFMFTPVALSGIAVISLLVVIMVKIVNRGSVFRELLRSLKSEGRGYQYMVRLAFAVNTILLAVLFLSYFTLFYLTESPFAKKYDAGTYLKIPELHVVSSLGEYLLPDKGTELDALPDPLVKKCFEAGMKVNSVTPEYPVLKNSIYFDKSKLIKGKPVMKPGTNIIIIFAESFSKYFTTEEMHHQKGLTPNIDDFKKYSITFENLYNIIAPTITGIIASTGSFPYYIAKYNITQHNRLTDLRFSFLTQILKKHGYYSMHLQGSSSDFASAETIFRNHGFDDFISLDNRELRDYALDPISGWGLRDRDLFRYAVHMLEERKSGEPFFMTLSTIDLHPPYHLSDADKKFTDPIFDCVHSTDLAFGIFWDYFKKSRYYGNTAVLFIADHAMVMNPKYFKLRGESFNRARQDTITAVLYVPGDERWRNRRVYTYATNLDIPPTFCDMMGIDDMNSFIGLSLFSERPRFPYVPGEVMLDGIFRTESGVKRKVDFTPEEHTMIYSFLTRLALNNRIFPPSDSIILQHAK